MGTKWLEPNELFHKLNLEALPVYYAAGPFFTEFLTKGELKVKISDTSTNVVCAVPIQIFGYSIQSELS